MGYHFDEFVERTGTDCYKWDARQHVFGSDDVLPLWVADLDIKTPDFIINALRKRLDHEILGYTFKPKGLNQAVKNWMHKRHAWNISEDWLLYCPGVVPSLYIAVQAFTKPGDKIIVQPPVYFPFFSAIKNNQREILYNPLKLKDGRYYMDLDDLKKKTDSRTTMIFICNPHNPGGAVWTKQELLDLAAFCLENNILMVSDEIHADIIYPGFRHIPLASLSDDIAARTVTVNAASKTFNIAGLSTSYIIISDKELREQYEKAVETVHVAACNIFGFIALEEAYNHGEEWLSQLMQYLHGNLIALMDFFQTHRTGITPLIPESTYLVWLDCRALNMNSNQLRSYMIDTVKLGLNDGPLFGPGGEGFQRINIACPRPFLMEALQRLSK